MTQLLVSNVPDAVAELLRMRAAERGVSEEEEHRRILREALAPTASGVDGRRSLFDQIRSLGKIAPDFEIEMDRSGWRRSETEL